MIISTWLILILGVLSFFVLPFGIWCFKNNKIKNILTIVFFCLYLVVLFCGVFGKLSIDEKVVKIDFEFTEQWCAKAIRWSPTNIGKFDLIINLVMLFPVGMLIYYFSRSKKWWVKLLFLIGFGLLTGVLIETFQFILPISRSVQLSDALLNMTSTFIGGLIAWGYIWFIDKIIHKNSLYSQ